MVYGVFGGCYSDWYIVGYFNNRLDADKYCAAYGNGDYYVKEMKDISDEKDLSQVALKYKHTIIFRYIDNQWVMDEYPCYECYIDERLGRNYVDCNTISNWVKFNINIDKDNRKLAEKIAQDYLYQLLEYGNGKLYKKNVALMNNQFKERYETKM